MYKTISRDNGKMYKKRNNHETDQSQGMKTDEHFNDNNASKVLHGIIICCHELGGSLSPIEFLDPDRGV